MLFITVLYSITYLKNHKNIRSNCFLPTSLASGSVSLSTTVVSFVGLRNYKKMKQHNNHHSGTWGDVEQESGGVCRKQFHLIFL